MEDISYCTPCVDGMLASIHLPGQAGAQPALQALSPFIVPDPRKFSARIRGLKGKSVVDENMRFVLEQWKAHHRYEMWAVSPGNAEGFYGPSIFAQDTMVTGKCNVIQRTSLLLSSFTTLFDVSRRY